MSSLASGAQGLERAELYHQDAVAIRARVFCDNLWLVFAVGGTEVLHFRIGPGGAGCAEARRFDRSDGIVQFEYVTALGPARTRVSFPSPGVPLVRCTTSVVPSGDLPLRSWERDLHALAPKGVVHTVQRGPRTGVVYASSAEEEPRFTLFYVQDFSALTSFAEALKKNWSDTVGGSWPHMGFLPEIGDGCILPKADEIVISDAYLIVAGGAPNSNEEIASRYIDLLAEVYLSLPLPAVEFHDWPNRAARTLRDLSVSPLCTYERRGFRYAMPYVADDSKPPESMVQLTLAVNLTEYDEWRGERSQLLAALLENLPSFFDEELGTIVRWLPGEPFSAGQAEENMNHEAMDSWYLHHALFNLFRLARNGISTARELFEKSLPYAVRVAQRFDYRWPIFFDLHSLDIVRAESKPGAGGETDVPGLYALVMIHAFEMFGDAAYLAEAKAAVTRLEGLGFDLAYQLNTTGFAAEATLRLWKMTGDARYRERSEVCLANIFDNLWLWRCEYGRARCYRTFFGLFPLQEAPYLAPFEELEAQAKAAEYLELGGEDLRAPVRLLLAEYQKYALDRTWFFYPDALPAGDLADESRNGRIERSLSIPLEDLRDGFSASGQVGQEIYGAGVPFVQLYRYFHKRADARVILYCDYPMHGFEWHAKGRIGFRTAGDPRGACELRVIPVSLVGESTAVTVAVEDGTSSKQIQGTLSAEGHAVFGLSGGQRVEVILSDARDGGEATLRVGPVRRHQAES